MIEVALSTHSLQPVPEQELSGTFQVQEEHPEYSWHFWPHCSQVGMFGMVLICPEGTTRPYHGVQTSEIKNRIFKLPK